MENSNIQKIVLASSLASLLMLSGCSSDSKNTTPTPESQAGLVIHSAKDVINPTSTDQVYKYFQDSATGAMSGPGNYGAFEYGAAGGHLMWPTFATYIVDDGKVKYKYQIISNYGENGVSQSGNLVVRYADLTNGGATFTANMNAIDQSVKATFNLSSGVIDPNIWHFAYQKYVGFSTNVEANVSACVAKSYPALYDANGDPVESAFSAMTATNTLSNFEAVVSADCNSSMFEKDGVKTAIKTSDWLDADYSTGAPVFSAKNDDNNSWIIRSSDASSYAHVSVSDVNITFGQTTTRVIKLDSELWDGSSWGSVRTSPPMSFSAETTVYWDLETNTLVSDTDAWELSVHVNGHDYPLQVNGGVGLVLTTD